MIPRFFSLLLLVMAVSGCGGGGGGTDPPPPAPVADFIPSTTSGEAPVTVDFTDASTGDVSSYSWDFGDGGSSTSQNPSHIYTAAGSYAVSLTVTGPGGSDTSTCLSCITVTDPPPVAGFIATPTSGDFDLTVAFTDTSIGDIDTRLWDFGDGITSTEQNPSHTYTAAGEYRVTLTAIGPGGADQYVCDSCIVVTSPAPVADFLPNPTSGTYDLVVDFTDSSTGPIDSRLWDFGDGSTSTESNPSHTYTIAGTFPVSLTVTGPGGIDTMVCDSCITVTDPPPVADFIASPTSGEAPVTVDFTDASTGDISSYSWDFGDGGSSTSQNPSHIYTAAGSYTVSLTVTGPGGSDTSTCASCITVTDPPPPPCNLLYPLDFIMVPAGVFLAAQIPTVACGDVTAWTISPALPAGLSFDTSNGIISGTALSDGHDEEHTIEASNSAGSISTSLRLRVDRIFTYSGTAGPGTFSGVTGIGQMSAVLRLEEDAINPNFPTFIAAFNLAISNDPTQLVCSSANESAFLQALNGGNGPDLWLTNLQADEVIVAAILSFTGPSVTQFEIAKEIVLVEYDTIPSAFIGQTGSVQVALQWQEDSAYTQTQDDLFLVDDSAEGVIPLAIDIDAILIRND